MAVKVSHKVNCKQKLRAMYKSIAFQVKARSCYTEISSFNTSRGLSEELTKSIYVLSKIQRTRCVKWDAPLVKFCYFFKITRRFITQVSERRGLVMK